MQYTRSKLIGLITFFAIITVTFCGCDIDKTEILSKIIPEEESADSESESQMVTASEAYDDFDNLVKYLVNEDSYAYDEDMISEWKSDDKKKIINDKLKTDAAKAYFVQGSIALFNNDCQEAVTCFENSISSLSDDNIKLKSRCYYELGRADIYLEKYDDYKNAAKSMEALFVNASAEEKEYLIKLNIWRNYDVIGIPDGGDLSYNIMQKTYEMANESGSSQMSEVLLEYASSCERAGQILKSTTYKLEAFSMAKENNDYSLMTSIATDLGISYMSSENYGQGLNYLKKAYQYAQMMDEKDYSKEAYIVSSICDVYIEMEAFEKCEEELKFYMELIDNIPEGKEKEDELTKYYLEYARYNYSINNLDEAFKYINMKKQPLVMQILIYLLMTYMVISILKKESMIRH